MESIKRLLGTCTAGLLFLGSARAADDYSAIYQWSFTGGNLVSNWSFENLSEEVCKTGPTGGVSADCRSADPSAKSGSFSLLVNSQSPGASNSTDFLPCEPSTTYSVSFYVHATWANRTGVNHPIVQRYRGDKTLAATFNGPTYESVFSQNTDGWKKYSFTFSTFADMSLIKLVFVNSTGTAGSPGNTFRIDNVLITKAGGEEGVVEARTYGDATGRVDQAVRNDGTLDLVSWRTYDDRGRPSRDYLPFEAVNGFPYDLTSICVGVRDPGEALEYDAATLNDAYNKLKIAVSQRDMTEEAPPILNVMVNGWGSAAPLRSHAASFTVLRDRNQNPVPFGLRGVVKYSADYNDILSRHPTTAYQGQPYGPTAMYYMHEARYSPEENAWTEYAYPDPGVNTISKVAVPGTGYGMTTGRVQSSGWALVSTDGIPSNVEYPPVSVTGEVPYAYQWSKDAQGGYSLSWTNREGRLAKTAQGVPGNWLVTTYDYDSFGRAIGTNTPGGMFYDKEYNGLGMVTAEIDPDRGRSEVLYDKRGLPRFMRTGGDLSNMIGTRYDTLGRTLGVGKTAQNWSQSQADDNYGTVPTTTADIGFFYDELNPVEFSSQTGVALSTVGLALAKLTHGNGRMVASFNRNTEAAIPGMTTPDRKLVATFYAYDAKGRVAYIYRYLGSVETAADRLQKIKFTYDQFDRLESRVVFKNYASDEATSTPSSESYFVYDEAGRIVYVLDKDSKVMVEYDYNSLEQMAGVTLYGKVKIEYTYDVRGAVTKIEAVTTASPPEHIFTEELGYHQKPNGHASIPDLPEHKKRWDGQISSILKKFSKDAPNPVDLQHFEYDAFDRLVTSGRYYAGSSALNADGSINFAQLSFAGSPTEGYWYGADGQITSRTGQGGVFNYAYRNNGGPTHQVENVSPALRRTGESMSAAGGNFLYDSRGRLYRDVGLNKTITYGYQSDKPTKIAMGSRNFHMLYDESNNRVAELEETGGTVVGRKTYVYASGLEVAKEIVQRTSAHPLGAVDLVKNSLSGVSGLVGFESEADGRKKLILKDHLGSTVKIVDEEAAQWSGQEEYAYSSYGILEKKVTGSGNLKPTGTFTGKEYAEALRLYDFGARWMDPELGAFLAPDPAGQYFNPYAYGPGDPINGTDPSGMVWDIFRPSKWGNALSDIWDTSSDIAGAAADGYGTIFKVIGNAMCFEGISDVCEQFYHGFRGDDWVTDEQYQERAKTAYCMDQGAMNYESCMDSFDASDFPDRGGQNSQRWEVGWSSNGGPYVKMGEYPAVGPGSEMVRGNVPQSKLDAGDAKVLAATNRIAQGVADEFDYLRLNSTHQFTMDIGLPTMKGVGHFVELAMPSGPLFAIPLKGTRFIAGKITGYTTHGLHQAIGREGVGVSAKAMLDAVRNPVKTIQQAKGAIKYVGDEATVILNSEGKVITTYGKPRGR